VLGSTPNRFAIFRTPSVRERDRNRNFSEGQVTTPGQRRFLLRQNAQAADLLQEYEAKIAALERMVGRQALEIEFLKGALKNAPRPRNANTSVIVGPAASQSQKDAG
jgi:hypothetical protein